MNGEKEGEGREWVPVCALSSLDTWIGTWLLLKLYTEQILSRPPQATKLPEGAKAQVITQDDRRGMA